MNEMLEGMWAKDTPYGSHVGLYMGAPDTIVMVFQRKDNENETRTITMPLRIEAFWDLLVLGNRLREVVDKKVKP